MSFQDNNFGEAGKVIEASDGMLKSSKAVATSLQGMLELTDPPSTTCSIYRVPEKLRKANMEAYTPRVVSIGPLHNGKGNLAAMEKHKLRYLQNFLSKSSKTLEECVEIISREEKRARDCYMESTNMSSEEFVKMLLVDACFIIQLILGFSKPEKDDPIYCRPWLIVDVRRDMTLLENQLPFFLLLSLLNLLDRPFHHRGQQDDFYYYSFLLFSVKFFVQMPEFKSFEKSMTEIKKKISSPHQINHFVDLLVVCLQPSSDDATVSLQSSSDDATVSLQPLPPDTKSDFKFVIPTATHLHEAGVQFKLGLEDEDRNFLDLRYRGNGVLEIPLLILERQCESLFRNLVAFEQCHTKKRCISDYIYLMSLLINTKKDVDLLVKKGIIRNYLGDSIAVKNLFNGIRIETIRNNETFHFRVIFEELNEYCNSRWIRCKATWNGWKAALRRDYFSSPWRGASTIAAVILLVLTFIQTVFTYMSVK